MERIEEVVFYKIEQAIKLYRQFAQRNINEAGFDVTIDQWLIMISIMQNSGASQLEIAKQTVKDSASVTRIIDLLIQKKYAERSVNEHDRRRTDLKLTKEGKDILTKVKKIVDKNRAAALAGISEKQINELKKTLTIIINNTSKQQL